MDRGAKGALKVAGGAIAVQPSSSITLRGSLITRCVVTGVGIATGASAVYIEGATAALVGSVVSHCTTTAPKQETYGGAFTLMPTKSEPQCFNGRVCSDTEGHLTVFGRDTPARSSPQYSPATWERPRKRLGW